MYKIYINQTPLFLIEDGLAREFAQKDGQHLISRYAGKSKFLLSYIDMLEKSSKFDSVVIYSSNLDQLYQDFAQHFKIIEAAGGVVVNEHNEVLLIFRSGWWDLPKGKIEDGESTELAAVREVMEETGVADLRLDSFLQHTYHTYRNKKGKRVLKLTHWYMMHAAKQPLIPQEEEGIERTEWMLRDQFFAANRPVFGNIKDLLLRLPAVD